MSTKYRVFSIQTLLFLLLLSLTTGYFLLTTNVSAQTPAVNERVVGLKTSVDRYVTHLEKIIDRSETLLDRIQTSVVKARAKGADTVELERLMNDSRARVASAEAKLNEVEEMKSTASTRANFVSIRDRLKSSKVELQLTKNNITQMVKILKTL